MGDMTKMQRYMVLWQVEKGLRYSFSEFETRPALVFGMQLQVPHPVEAYLEQAYGNFFEKRDVDWDPTDSPLNKESGYSIRRLGVGKGCDSLAHYVMEQSEGGCRNKFQNEDRWDSVCHCMSYQINDMAEGWDVSSPQTCYNDNVGECRATTTASPAPTSTPTTTVKDSDSTQAVSVDGTSMTSMMGILGPVAVLVAASGAELL